MKKTFYIYCALLHTCVNCTCKSKQEAFIIARRRLALTERDQLTLIGINL